MMMGSREKILATVKNNQPALQALPDVESIPAIVFDDAVAKFTTVLQSIGGNVQVADSLQQVVDFVHNNFTDNNKYVTTITALDGIEKINSELDAHQLEDVEVAVINAALGIAENGAVWVTTDEVKVRVLPFICQHLVVLLNPTTIVQNMHEAYTKIGTTHYDFGVFIAGPSKTADIEQSLVLGAHGPKSMTVFLLSI